MGCCCRLSECVCVRTHKCNTVVCTCRQLLCLLLRNIFCSDDELHSVSLAFGTEFSSSSHLDNKHTHTHTHKQETYNGGWLCLWNGVSSDPSVCINLRYFFSVQHRHQHSHTPHFGIHNHCCQFNTHAHTLTHSCTHTRSRSTQSAAIVAIRWRFACAPLLRTIVHTNTVCWLFVCLLSFVSVCSLSPHTRPRSRVARTHTHTDTHAIMWAMNSMGGGMVVWMCIFCLLFQG